jgi:hypothetical protein
MELKEGQKVKVYRNLRNGKWSVMDAKTRKVVAHATHLDLREVDFKVSQAGRDRVLKEKQKNVHAFAVGILEAVQGTNRSGERIGFNENKLFSTDANPVDMYQKGFKEVRYNPYESPWFYGLSPEGTFEGPRLPYVMRFAPRVVAVYGTMYARTNRWSNNPCPYR